MAPYPGDNAGDAGAHRHGEESGRSITAASAHFGLTTDYFFYGPDISPAYNDDEVDSLDPSGIFSLEHLLGRMATVDYSDVTKFPDPIFMFMGRHDYYTPPREIDDWFEKLDAPTKQGVWFENSAHMIPWEEPGKVLMSLVHDVRPFAEVMQRPIGYNFLSEYQVKARGG